jgi:hypothetical protein
MKTCDRLWIGFVSIFLCFVLAVIACHLRGIESAQKETAAHASAIVKHLAGIEKGLDL